MFLPMCRPEPQVIQGYTNYTDVDFYLVGFTTTSDASAPNSVTEVNDGNGADIDTHYITNWMQVNWNEADDPESGIARYFYSLSTTEQDANIIDWTNVGLNKEVTVTGLDLTVGTTYYFNVKVENTQGSESTITSSDGFQIIQDPSPPSTVGQVRDGASTTSDQSTTYSRSQLSFNWNASTDNESKVFRYIYAVGTAEGAANIVDWTDNGLNTNVTHTGLTLIPGTKYYAAVKALNTQSMESETVNSNGILVINDLSPPSAIVELRDGHATDSDIAYSNIEIRANWDAVDDPESEITNYYYAIGTTPGGTDIVDWTDNGLSTSMVHTGLILTRGTTYYTGVIVENESGLMSAITYSDGITIQYLCTNEVVANSGSAFDIQTAINQVHALGGGTVHIPEGDFELLNTVSLFSNITLMGAGIGKTVLQHAGNAHFSCETGGHTMIRISGISFYGNQIIYYRSVVDFRIDHCYFKANQNTSNLINLNNMSGCPSIRGVVDHCTFCETDYTTNFCIHCGPKYWTEGERGIEVLGSAEAIFIEDCYFDHIYNHPVGAFNGSNYVVRHCTSICCGSWDGHGPGYEYIDTQYHGTRCYEFYNNQFIETEESSQGERWSSLGLRSGSGVIYNNTFIYFRNAVRFTLEPGSVTASGGEHPAFDQIHDMWLWNNDLIDTDELILFDGANAADFIQENRDYFLRSPSLAQDGFKYIPYPYPHYLVIGDPVYQNTVRLKARVYLEGAYLNGLQNCQLHQSGHIPIRSPYRDTRTVSSIHPNIVDWVEVELRTDPSIAGEKYQSALLRNDGQIVDIDGSTDYLTFDTPDGLYYIVVHHRNHLAVISDKAVHLSNQ
ncbi:fibronectin type III domain-containing protein [bacterium]|nr:fibronectin type III domain-containing protein [bacterium]